MSTQYRLVQSGKTASGGCSAGQGSSEPVAPRIVLIDSLELLRKSHYINYKQTEKKLTGHPEALGVQQECWTCKIYTTF
jgi:hypothetical protein